VLEGGGGTALTEDYLRVGCTDATNLDRTMVHTGVLKEGTSGLRIDLTRSDDLN